MGGGEKIFASVYEAQVRDYLCSTIYFHLKFPIVLGPSASTGMENLTNSYFSS